MSVHPVELEAPGGSTWSRDLRLDGQVWTRAGGC